MAEILFNYNGIITTICCGKDEKMSQIFERYEILMLIDGKGNEIYYCYNNGVISQDDKNLTFNEMANSIDKERKKMDIIVIINEKKKEEIIIRSKNIICPKCNRDIKMKFNNIYNIDLYDCENNHKFNNIPLDEFESTQMINISKIKCEICKNDKGETYKNIFYKCNECNINICPLCQINHNKNHIMIDYDKINYICNKHDEPFTSYCKKCNKNICSKCEKEHINHENISFINMIIDKKDLLNKINDIKNIINVYNENIYKIIEILNNMKKDVNNYYKLIEYMVNNYNEKERNYEILNNINEMINNIIINDIKKINNEYDIKIKFNNILDIYNKKNINEIKMKIKIEKNDINKKIYFLDNTDGEIGMNIEIKDTMKDNGEPERNVIKEEHHHDFLKELNETNVELFINDKKYKYQKYFIPDKDGEYNILLKFNILIKDCSFMFYKCSNLINIDLSSFNTQNVTNMSMIFEECSNLKKVKIGKKFNENIINQINKDQTKIEYCD